MPYARISTEMREALIRAYEDGRDFILIAENLNINRRTAYGIVQRYKKWEESPFCLEVVIKHRF